MRALIVLKDNSETIKNSVKKVLPREIKADFAWKNTLKHSNFKNKDLIVSIGGDGTFLSTSHFTEGPILGVNLDTEKSEGALTTVTILDLEKKLKQILNKKIKIKEYQREQIKIHQTKTCTFTELALNETYIGNINPHHSSNYLIKFKNKHESQRSSGILVSTGTGSTAWYKSMSQRPFSREKKQLRFIVREPFSRRIHKATIKKGKIKQSEKITIVNLMHHSLLAVDGIRTYHLNYKDKVEISLGKPLKVIQ